MLTRLLISLHHILHKNRRIMPQTTTMSMTDRSASCTLHNIIPLNAITFIASKIKYWDSELVYWKPQNIHQVSTWHQSAFMNIWFLCNTSLTFLQNCQCTKFLCWKNITWKPRISPWEFPSLGKSIRSLRDIITYLFFTHKPYAL